MGEYVTTRYPGIFQYVGKNGTVYGIDYYAGGKKHREIIGPLLGEAQEKLAEKKALAKKGGIVSISQKRKIILKELKERYEEIQRGESYFEKTRKYFMKPILDFFGEAKQLYRITTLDIENFKKKRKESPARWKKVRSDVTVNREIETLRHMLNKAIEWGMLDENPFDKFKNSIFYEEKNDRVRYLTEDEIKRLLTVSPPYLRNIIKAAILTGLRKGDTLNLKWSNVDLEKGILFFNEQKKRGKKVSKVLNGDFIDLLMTIRKGKSEYIFNGPIPKEKSKKEYIAYPDPDGKPLTEIKKSFKTALKNAGIKDFHFHDLRHTSASYMVMRGASMKAVQEHLGHSNLSMTERYSHLSPDFQRSEVARLNGLCDESSKKIVRSEELTQNEVRSEIHATA